MTLLVYAGDRDVHADAVAWAWTQQGRRCDLVRFGDYPGALCGSASISDQCDLAISSTRQDAAPIDHAIYDVVWNRRVGAGHWGSPPTLHADDREVARKARQSYLDAVRFAAWPGQIWVNPRRRQICIEDKVNQLRLARRCGLAIPDTLVSNDPDAVRAFVHRVGGAIAKPLRPMIWDGTRPRAMPTVSVTVADLANDAAIAACPMIYQERITKSFELRAVLFGAELLCCRLDSQRVSRAQVDFRMVDPSLLDVTPWPASDSLRRALLEFARAAGLLHASFDLAVAPDGRPVFFECNEQGQTLWLEDCNGEIRILDRLVAFLTAPSTDFLWDGTARHSFLDFPVSPRGGTEPQPGSSGDGR